MFHGSIAGKKEGTTSIEQISAVYGKQAVVVSIDPRRVYVTDPASVSAEGGRRGIEGNNTVGKRRQWSCPLTPAACTSLTPHR